MPKPAEQRRRRNATVPMVQLPLEGYSGDIPEWPLQIAHPGEIDRWNTVWRHPAAVLWKQQRLELIVARYVRDCLKVEADNKSAALLKAEVRQQEDRLGLNPYALMRLRWEVVQDEVAVKRDDNVRQPARRLRAVDPGEAKAA